MLRNYVTDRRLSGNAPVTVLSTDVDSIEKRSFGFGASYSINLKDGTRINVDRADARRVAASCGITLEE